MTAVALLLGVASARVHLRIVAWRARAAVSGRLGSSVLAAPVGVLLPLGGLGAVLWAAPEATWAWAVGLIAGRLTGLARWSREGAWTR